MSSYGAHTVNSGPLEIRTLSNNPTNQVYFLQASPHPDSELPVSSNRLLITSTNGLLAPSEQAYISSITLSSLVGITASISSLGTSLLQTSTLIASTATLANVQVSSLLCSSITGTTLTLMSTLSTTNVSTTNMYTSTIIGGSGSITQCNTIQVLNQITAASNFTNLSSVTCGSMTGSGVISVDQMIGVTLSTQTLYTQSFGTNLLSTTVLTLSSFSTNHISIANGNGSTISLVSINVNSSIMGSSIVTSTISYVNLLTDTIQTANMTVSTLLVSTTNGTNITSYTLFGSTVNTTQQFTSSVVASSMLGSSITISTMTTSTLLATSIFGSTMNLSILSTLMPVTNTSVVLNIYGSTCTTGSYSVAFAVLSTMLGSTVITSSLTTSIVSASSIAASTALISSMSGPILSISSMSISSLITPINSLSTLIASSLYGNTLTTSTMNISSLFLSSIFINSATLSSINISTVNNVQVKNGSSNHAVGYQTFLNNTSGTNNSAFGYNTLTANTSGSNHTAFGTQALYTTTSGNSNTVIGTSTMITTGSYNTYIGYGAAPSTTNVTNEIVIGGSATNGTLNTGYGSNTAVLGNSATTITRLYGSVGIGTVSPLGTLDVRGTYNQTGGNVSIIYDTSGNGGTTGGHANLFFIYNDGAAGMGMFLNDTVRTVDGGSRAGTLRNDYGKLRLQAASGYTNPTYGITVSTTYTGIGNTSPTFNLDVNGGIRCISNGSITYGEGSNTAFTAYSPTVSGSIWMGFDPIVDCGYINAGQVTNVIKPVILQARGGFVGIGKTNPAAELDVTGSVRYSNNLLIDGSLSCNSAIVNGSTLTAGSPWTGLPGSDLSYTGNVNITGNLNSTGYVGLVNATTSTYGIAQINTIGLSITSSSPSLSLPCIFCSLSTTTNNTAYGYTVKISSIQASSMTIGGDGLTAFNIHTTIAGTYRFIVSGSEGGTSGPDTIIISDTSYNEITRTQTQGFSGNNNPVSCSFIYHMSSTPGTGIQIFNQQNGSTTLNNVFIVGYMIIAG